MPMLWTALIASPFLLLGVSIFGFFKMMERHHLMVHGSIGPAPAYGQTLRFVLVGLIGLGANAAAYTGLTYLGWSYDLAWAGAWLVSIPVGYVLHRTFTFESRTNVARSFPRVVAIYAVQQGLLVGGIALMVGFGLHQITAYWIALPAAVVFSFLAMKYFGFR